MQLFAKKKKKNAEINKTNKVLVREDIFSKCTYVCVLRYQIPRFYHSSDEFQRGTNFTLFTTKRTPKRSTLIRVKKTWSEISLHTVPHKTSPNKLHQKKRLR